MALTPLRWIAAAVAGCLILLYALMGIDRRYRNVRPRDSKDADRDKISSRTYAEERRTRGFAVQYRMTQLLDSTRRGVDRGATTPPGVRAFYDSAIPREARPALESLVARAAGRSTEMGKVGVDVYFVYDTIRFVRGVLRATVYGSQAAYQIPMTAGERCTVLVRIGRDPSVQGQIARVFRSQAAADQLLGPCAYYRAFGSPGPGVSDWLSGGGWMLGVDGSWSRPPIPLQIGPPRSKYSSGPSLALRYLSPTSIRCVRGEVDRCEASAIAGVDRPVLKSTANIVTRSVTLGPRMFGSPRFGVREPEMLAGMVRTIGRDRFEKFWTAGDSVAPAFRRAAGEPLGVWVSRWMVEQYGAVEAGPRVGALTLFGSLLVAALAVFVALRANARRHFA